VPTRGRSVSRANLAVRTCSPHRHGHIPARPAPTRSARRQSARRLPASRPTPADPRTRHTGRKRTPLEPRCRSSVTPNANDSLDAPPAIRRMNANPPPRLVTSSRGSPPSATESAGRASTLHGRAALSTQTNCDSPPVRVGPPPLGQRIPNTDGSPERRQRQRVRIQICCFAAPRRWTGGGALPRRAPSPGSYPEPRGRRRWLGALGFARSNADWMVSRHEPWCLHSPRPDCLHSPMTNLGELITCSSSATPRHPRGPIVMHGGGGGRGGGHGGHGGGWGGSGWGGDGGGGCGGGGVWASRFSSP